MGKFGFFRTYSFAIGNNEQILIEHVVSTQFSSVSVKLDAVCEQVSFDTARPTKRSTTFWAVSTDEVSPKASCRISYTGHQPPSSSDPPQVFKNPKTQSDYVFHTGKLSHGKRVPPRADTWVPPLYVSTQIIP